MWFPPLDLFHLSNKYIYLGWWCSAGHRSQPFSDTITMLIGCEREASVHLPSLLGAGMFDNVCELLVRAYAVRGLRAFVAMVACSDASVDEWITSGCSLHLHDSSSVPYFRNLLVVKRAASPASCKAAYTPVECRQRCNVNDQALLGPACCSRRHHSIYAAVAVTVTRRTGVHHLVRRANLNRSTIIQPVRGFKNVC